ncbi:MAG: methyltransferase [Frankiales bacterium]|nr:methyltransferase [Frankiales bacterium]
MTRIIAGSAGGRRLLVPSGTQTRPTADRAREGLFSSLQSLTDVEGSRFLDLYAGTGAIGLEALSRGAGAATLVDDDPRALAAIRGNVEALGLPAVVVELEVSRFLAGEPSPYDVVVLDPPYELDVDPVLAALVPWLAEDAVVVAERRTRGPAPAVPEGLRPERSRRYGEATLWYFSRL